MANEIALQAMHILERLIGFNSVSRDTNLPVIDFIESYLERHGIECVTIPSPDGHKANLLARIGPEVAGGIILSGHTDVVPVDGQTWETDPFTLTERDGKLYGRGTSDMKSFIAVCMALAPHLLESQLKKPVYLAFSYDEEVGCLGVPYLLDYIVKHLPSPAFALIGEPTLMQVVTAHKGVLSFETTVYGLEFHSSQTQQGINAVQIACELVHFLVQVAQEVASDLQDARFMPPYTTVHVGTIRGGTARNIIPKECHFQWEIRPLPGADPDAIIERFQKRCVELIAPLNMRCPNASITTHPISRMLAVTLPEDAQAHAQTIMHAANTNQQHAVSFGTEAGVFQAYHIPAIICGPGSIEQAHKPNEFIEKAQIEECVKFLLRLITA